MMDKCDAIIKAVRKVFPDAEIRICFFHVMQAFKRTLRRAEIGVVGGAWSRCDSSRRGTLQKG